MSRFLMWKNRAVYAESRLETAEGLLREALDHIDPNVRQSGYDADDDRADLQVSVGAFLAQSNGTRPPGSVPASEASEDAKESAGRVTGPYFTGQAAPPDPVPGACPRSCGRGQYWTTECRTAGSCIHPARPPFLVETYPTEGVTTTTAGIAARPPLEPPPCVHCRDGVTLYEGPCPRCRPLLEPPCETCGGTKRVPWKVGVDGACPRCRPHEVPRTCYGDDCMQPHIHDHVPEPEVPTCGTCRGSREVWEPGKQHGQFEGIPYKKPCPACRPVPREGE